MKPGEGEREVREVSDEFEFVLKFGKNAIGKEDLSCFEEVIMEKAFVFLVAHIGPQDFGLASILLH